jgi:hypothetical protein
MDTFTSFFSNIELDSVVNQLVFILCALLGGLAHWLKKAIKHETSAKFHEWFGEANTHATVYTFIVFFVVIIGCLAANIVEATGFWATLYIGFVTGFAIDAGCNSDSIALQSVSAPKPTITVTVEDPQAHIPTAEQAQPSKIKVVIRQRVDETGKA